MKKRTTPLVSIIITAYNEEKTIEKVILHTKKTLKKVPHEIIVIDDASTDKTAHLAKKTGAHTVISHKTNAGKGKAFQTGIKHAVGEYIIQIDADYQFLPQEIPKLLLPLQNGFDVALGTRYQKGAKIQTKSVDHIRLIGSHGLSFITSLFAKKRITDVMAGFKGFRRSVLTDIKPTVSHFGYEAEVVIKAAQKKYKIINVPISYKRRAFGKSNVNSFKHGFLVLATIIKTGSHLFNAKKYQRR